MARTAPLARPSSGALGSSEAPRFVVGIDLGTTHTALAFASLDEGAGRAAPGRARSRLEVRRLEQLVGASEVGTAELLPSVLYAPLAHETVADPWGETPWAIGAFARRRGAEVPSRAVTSAKSWLCHAELDRRAASLPWVREAAPRGSEHDDPASSALRESAAPAEAATPRLSPVEASARVLSHLRATWDAAHPEAPLARQLVVLTVPASFDEVARELTVEAATQAGLEVRLLEEPQAAFYHLLDAVGPEALAQDAGLATGTADILVCDVGGGTTDLSLLRLERDATGALVVERVAVGRHLLLGGDNIDLALAHLLEARLVGAAGERLPPAEFLQLVARARDAKERLLGEGAPDEVVVSLAGRGSSLLGGARSAKLGRDETLRLVLDGFFPLASLAALGRAGARRERSGLVAFGLPYEREPAITRHVAEFLLRHGGVIPQAILLNGGVFKSQRLAERLLEATRGFAREQRSAVEPRLLAGAAPELAVARGAAAYGLALLGRGMRIGGGSAQGFYVGVAAAKGAPSALCVLPRGSHEGARHEVRQPGLAVTVGAPVRFLLFQSDARTDAVGALVSADDEALAPLPPVVTRLGDEVARRGTALPVRLEAELTAAGTLELACVEETRGQGVARRHRLAFDLRASAPARPSPKSVASDPKLGRASEESAVYFERAQPTIRGAQQLFGAGLAPDDSEAREAAPTSSTGNAPRERAAEPAGERAQALDAPTPHATVAAEKARAGAPQELGAVETLIEGVFGGAPGEASAKLARGLMRELEQRLGARDTWTQSVCRALFDRVGPRRQARRRSADHERLFWQLSGYCLRPGFGDPGDERRLRVLAPLLAESLSFPEETRTWQQLFIAWRRIAAGLAEPAQEQLRDRLDPFLAPRSAGLKKPKKFEPLAPTELLALAAYLERVPAERRIALGDWLLQPSAGAREAREGRAQLWSALGRLGARVPTYASAHHVVPADVAERWLERLLAESWDGVPTAPWAAMQLARATGDRARDVGESLRAGVLTRLGRAGARDAWLAAVREPVALDAAARAELFGEGLPLGLTLALTGSTPPPSEGT